MIRDLGLKLLPAALALVSLAALPASAQSSAATPAAGAGLGSLAPVYDLSKEIKVQGNIYKIESVAAGSGLLGTHVQIQTPQGLLDAHLGSGAFDGAHALGLQPGQSVTITGMMATIDGNSILLARVLTTSNRIFLLRNERGIPARSLAPRGESSSANPVKGGN